METKRALFICLILFAFISSARASDNFIQLKAILDFTTKASEGNLSLEQIINIARENQVSIVIPTDRDHMLWEYGLWPLRKIIRKKVEHNSLAEYGVNKYLKEIKDLRKKYADMVIIPATESAPFYYWQGSYFKNNLTMHDWHKHIITMGLEKESDYDYLPVIGNEKALARGFSIYKFWPLLVIFLGLLCLRKRKYNYKDSQRKSLGPISAKWRLIGIILVFTGIVFFLNNFPFSEYAFDQYHGNLGNLPYQQFVDYVADKGGLTFWDHPEAEYVYSAGDVDFKTYRHTNLLLELKNYTGFAIFYEGYETAGKPSGIWDQSLKEYCQGQRKNPAWAVAGLGFEKEDLKKLIRDLQTIVLVKNKDKQSVLDAFRKGRLYVARGKRSFNFKLDEFYVHDKKGLKGYAGEELDIDGNPSMHIKGGFTDIQEPVQVK
ncbi:MAG: hypothetical protein JW867_07835, partial [Candidatus Omnitrophica bacterium]|nr:hypothetical protein [Candidatus Omnitrophota bacterium]